MLRLCYPPCGLRLSLLFPWAPLAALWQRQKLGEKERKRRKSAEDMLRRRRGRDAVLFSCADQVAALEVTMIHFLPL